MSKKSIKLPFIQGICRIGITVINTGEIKAQI